MKPFKVSHENPHRHMRWLSWLLLGLGILYIALAIQSYLAQESTSTWIIHLFNGLVWTAISFIKTFGNSHSFPDITLSDTGISFKNKKETKLIHWDQIERINIDNNSLALYLQTDEHEELNIAYLQYKELQRVKSKLKGFTKINNVSYSSKY